MDGGLRAETLCKIFFQPPLKDVHGEALLEARSRTKKNYTFPEELGEPFIELFSFSHTSHFTSVDNLPFDILLNWDTDFLW